MMLVCVFTMLVTLPALKLNNPEFDVEGATYDEECGNRMNYKCWKKGGHSLEKKKGGSSFADGVASCDAGVLEILDNYDLRGEDCATNPSKCTSSGWDTSATDNPSMDDSQVQMTVTKNVASTDGTWDGARWDCWCSQQCLARKASVTGTPDDADSASSTTAGVLGNGACQFWSRDARLPSTSDTFGRCHMKRYPGETSNTDLYKASSNYQSACVTKVDGTFCNSNNMA